MKQVGHPDNGHDQVQYELASSLSLLSPHDRPISATAKNQQAEHGANWPGRRTYIGF